MSQEKLKKKDRGGNFMKKYGILPFIALFLFVIFFFSAHAQETKGPKLVLKEQVFDFKEVKEGQVLEHAFQIFNHGDQPLEIKKVNPG